MPKKTRKEKLRAQQRRTAPTTVSLSSSPNSPVHTSSGYTFQSRTTERTTSTVSAADTGELRAVRLELTKTTLLALVAIAVEFFLFWRGGGKW